MNVASFSLQQRIKMARQVLDHDMWRTKAADERAKKKAVLDTFDEMAAHIQALEVQLGQIKRP